MRYFLLPLLASLAGCATLPDAAQPGDPRVRLLASGAEADVRQIVLNIGEPLPPFTDVSAGLARAQAEAAGLAILTDDGSLRAQYAALAVTLRICVVGVDRLEAASREDAVKLARGSFALTCLLPLGGFALR